MTPVVLPFDLYEVAKFDVGAVVLGITRRCLGGWGEGEVMIFSISKALMDITSTHMAIVWKWANHTIWLPVLFIQYSLV